MKITLQPAKRKSFSIYDKGRIIIEAYSVPRNVKPTARKYDVQPKMIRRWKTLKWHIRYEESQVRSPPRRNGNVGGEDETDSSSHQWAIERKEALQSRKRYSTSYRFEGGGRKPKCTTDSTSTVSSSVGNGNAVPVLES